MTVWPASLWCNKKQGEQEAESWWNLILWALPLSLKAETKDSFEGKAWKAGRK